MKKNSNCIFLKAFKQCWAFNNTKIFLWSFYKIKFRANEINSETNIDTYLTKLLDLAARLPDDTAGQALVNQHPQIQVSVLLHSLITHTTIWIKKNLNKKNLNKKEKKHKLITFR